MADQQPSSPFSGLDKALLRSTKPKPFQPEPGPAQADSVIELARADVPSPEPVASPQAGRPDARTVVRPDERPPGRRNRVRHPFELYEDQVKELRRLSAEAKLRDEERPMSIMVREALDDFLQKERKKM